MHEEAQLFVEFPGSTLGSQERADWAEIQGERIRIISPEDLLVDRLGAWQYWRSSVDGANAFLLWLALQDEIDEPRLQARIEEAGWIDAWVSLKRFAEIWRDKLPSREEVEKWANAGPR